MASESTACVMEQFTPDCGCGGFMSPEATIYVVSENVVRGGLDYAVLTRRFATQGGPFDSAQGGLRPPYIKLVFVVLVGLVHGEAAELVGDFEQVLIAVIPIGAELTEKHGSLVGPTQLQVSDF